MSDIVRTHDKFYLNEDRKRTPKETFKFIRLVKRFLPANSSRYIAVPIPMGITITAVKPTTHKVPINGASIPDCSGNLDP